VWSLDCPKLHDHLEHAKTKLQPQQDSQVLDFVIREHFPKHILNSVLKYVDCVAYLGASHLLVVKSPVVGVCIIEPTLRESYHIIKIVSLKC
jgi:hypothetical protein